MISAISVEEDEQRAAAVRGPAPLLRLLRTAAKPCEIRLFEKDSVVVFPPV